MTIHSNLNPNTRPRSRQQPLVSLTQPGMRSNSHLRMNSCQSMRKSTPAIRPSLNSTNPSPAMKKGNQCKNSSLSPTLGLTPTSNPKACSVSKKPRKRKWRKPCARTANYRKRIQWSSISSQPQCPNRTSTSTTTKPRHSNHHSHNRRNSKCQCSTPIKWTIVCR